MTKGRKILAYLVSPLSAILCIAVLIGIESFARWAFGIAAHVNDPPMAVIMVIGLTVGIPAIYALALIIGIPTVFWLERKGAMRLRIFVIAGAFWGVLLSLGVGMAISSPMDADYLFGIAASLIFIGLPTVVAFIVCGLVIQGAHDIPHLST